MKRLALLVLIALGGVGHAENPTGAFGMKFGDIYRQKQE
jgi:hypothetical protein